MKKALFVLVLVGLTAMFVGCDVTVGDITTTAADDVEAVVDDVEDMVDAAVSDAKGLVCAGREGTCEFLGIE